MLFLLLFNKNKRGRLDGKIFTTSTLMTEHNSWETQMSRAVDQRGNHVAVEPDFDF